MMLQCIYYEKIPQGVLSYIWNILPFYEKGCNNMSSKQINLLKLILGCAVLVFIGGICYAGYRYAGIVSAYGIDAPFEDFTNSEVLTRVLYAINHYHEMFEWLLP